MLRNLRIGCPVVVCFAVTLTQAMQVSSQDLRSALSHAMARRSGTAIVLDVRSSRVLASYRPDVAARRLALPGSSVKPFTLMALLEAGKLDAQTLLVCKRSVSIAGRTLDCTHPDVKQPLDPATALAYSCNSYFRHRGATAYACGAARQLCAGRFHLHHIVTSR